MLTDSVYTLCQMRLDSDSKSTGQQVLHASPMGAHSRLDKENDELSFNDAYVRHKLATIGVENVTSREGGETARGRLIA